MWILEDEPGTAWGELELVFDDISARSCWDGVGSRGVLREEIGVCKGDELGDVLSRDCFSTAKM